MIAKLLILCLLSSSVLADQPQICYYQGAGRCSMNVRWSTLPDRGEKSTATIILGDNKRALMGFKQDLTAPDSVNSGLPYTFVVKTVNIVRVSDSTGGLFQIIDFVAQYGDTRVASAQNGGQCVCGTSQTDYNGLEASCTCGFNCSA